MNLLFDQQREPPACGLPVLGQNTCATLGTTQRKACAVSTNLPTIWDIGNAGQKTTPASEKKFERFAYLAWLFASESWTAVCVSG